MKSIAEVVESSTHRVVAQCTQRKDRPPIALPPPYGSLVLIEGEPETVAVVCSITTTGYDPNRRATALEQGSYEETYLEYPELVELHITQIEAIPVGFGTNGEYIQGTPPTPPPLHASVRRFPPRHWPRFLDKLHFLRLLGDVAGGSSRELFVQTILHLLAGAPDEPTRQEWLLRIGRELARILKGDYDQLKSILERIQD